MSQIFKQFCKLFISVLIFSLCGVSNALTISEYKQKINNPTLKPLIEVYVSGIGQGIFWSSIYNKVNGGSELLCPPKKMAFTGKIVLSVWNNAISENRFKDDDIVSLSMINEYQRVFPCK